MFMWYVGERVGVWLYRDTFLPLQTFVVLCHDVYVRMYLYIVQLA